MENATKALIIAASVLIVIILIALSINILSSTSNVTDQVGTVSSNLEINMFNSQFEQFFGTNVSGVQLKSLISKIIVNNSQNMSHIIMIDLHNSSGDIIKSVHNPSDPNVSELKAAMDLISSNKRYQVNANNLCGTYPGGYNDGYIACIYIKEL